MSSPTGRVKGKAASLSRRRTVSRRSQPIDHVNGDRRALGRQDNARQVEARRRKDGMQVVGEAIAFLGDAKKVLLERPIPILVVEAGHGINSRRQIEMKNHAGGLRRLDLVVRVEGMIRPFRRRRLGRETNIAMVVTQAVDGDRELRSVRRQRCEEQRR